MSNIIYTVKWQSPVGEMLLGTIGDSVCICDWSDCKRRDTIDRRICKNLDAVYKTDTSPVINRLIAELTEYFDGRRKHFDLPVKFSGTPFQCLVWQELMKIPYGATISYAALAQRIGNIRAVRAVANANAMNPVSILVPCHRVIGSNNTLTGYGGGLEAKQALLALEAHHSGCLLPL